jgi:hypothetical protein
MPGSNAIDVASNAVNAAYPAAYRASTAKADSDRVGRAEQAAQDDLLRDIAGNPFRPIPTVDPAWLTWHDGTVRRLAETIYEERRFAARSVTPAGSGRSLRGRSSRPPRA